MKIQTYNSNRYAHVTNLPNVDFWWDIQLKQIVKKSIIQQKVLALDNTILQCGAVCVGSPINCCDASLLTNNLDCLFSNENTCLDAN